MHASIVACLAMVGSVGCQARTSVERGALLFADPATSSSSINFAACADCHTTGELPADRVLAGGTLRGVLGRPSYWGGAVLDPRDAIETCLYYFMFEPERDSLAGDEPRGLDLLAFLETLGTEPSDAVPFTVPRGIVTALPAGDSARGESTYRAACHTCHGDAHTGAARRSDVVPVIPEETIAEHGTLAREIMLTRVRHGGFFGIGGVMPPFSLETLDDQEVADVVAFLGL